MKKLLVTLFVVASFAGLSYVSAVADSGKTCDKKGESCCAEMPAALKLSKEQKEKIDEISTECKKAKIQNEADIKTARIDVSTLLKKDIASKASIDAKIDELGELVKKAIKNKYDCKARLLSVLDAEQKKAYFEAKKCCEEGDHHDCCGKGGDHDCGHKGDHKDCGTRDKKTCDKKEKRS